MDINVYIDKIVKHHLFKEFLQVVITPTYFYVEMLYGGNQWPDEDLDSYKKLLVHSNKNFIKITGFFDETIIYKDEYNYIEILDKFIYLDQITVHKFPDDAEGTTKVTESLIKDRRNNSIDDILNGQ